MPSGRGATRRWRRVLPQRAATFERVLSLLIVLSFKPRWARDGDEGEDDTYDRFIGGLPVGAAEGRLAAQSRRSRFVEAAVRRTTRQQNELNDVDIKVLECRMSPTDKWDTLFSRNLPELQGLRTRLS